MKNRKSWIIIRLALAVLVLPAWAYARLDNPVKGLEPDARVRAQVAAQKVDLMADANLEGPRLQGILTTLQDVTRSEQSPLMPQIVAYKKRLADHRSDSDKYDIDDAKYKAEQKRRNDDLAAYEADGAAYRQAGGGGTVSQAEFPALNAWYLRRVQWQTRQEEWRGRLNAWAARSNVWAKAYNSEDAQLKDIRASLERELDQNIAALKFKIVTDRRELDRYSTTLPGLHADVEAMALEADQAREDGKMAAIDKAIGLALDGAISSMNARELLARGQLRQVKDILIRSGVRPDDAKKVLKGWFDQPNSVRSIMHTKQMLEQLGTLRDIASAYDSTTKKQYYEALAACLGIFVQTPMLKLAITNFEVYSNLLYTGLSYATARARVDQYSKLADAELLAIAKISELYKKHLRQLAELTKAREELSVI